jgi:hypothetical protein
LTDSLRPADGVRPVLLGAGSGAHALRARQQGCVSHRRRAPPPDYSDLVVRIDGPVLTKPKRKACCFNHSRKLTFKSDLVLILVKFLQAIRQV